MWVAMVTHVAMVTNTSLLHLRWLLPLLNTCVFTFHLQISQSNLIQHHTLLMKLMALFRSQLLQTGHHPQHTMVLHCSTQ